MDCRLAARILDDIAPGLRAIVEVLTKKSFVEACEENLFRKVLEMYYGKEGAEIVIRVLEVRTSRFFFSASYEINPGYRAAIAASTFLHG